jgi:hypothetical protein
MKALFHLAVCGALLASGAMAQRGGGGHGGGGMGGGGMRGGGGMGGGMRGGGMSMGGGFRGGAVGGFRGGAVGGFGGFRGGFGGFRGGFGGFRGRTVVIGGCGWGGFCGGWGGWGWGGVGWGWPGYGYSDPGYLDSSYADYSGGYPGYSGGYAGYPTSGGQPSTVNVIYPPAPPAQTSVYVEHASPVIHEYDQYGQQLGGPEGFNGAPNNSVNSPIYLIATKDHTIQAALAYSITGSILQYTTLDHQLKVVQMIQVDRDLTLRLNRERHVSFQMP